MSDTSTTERVRSVVSEAARLATQGGTDAEREAFAARKAELLDYLRSEPGAASTPKFAGARPLAITPRDLQLTTAEGQVIWTEVDDLPSSRHGNLGRVLVDLDVDGEHFDEVRTETGVSAMPIDVLDGAIRALTLARAGLAQTTTAPGAGSEAQR